MYRVKRGRLDPVSLVLRIRSSDAAPDLTLATDVELEVTDLQSGVGETWTTTITAQTTTLLVAVHPFETSDTATVRRLEIKVFLTITGAAHRVETEDCFELHVVEC